MTGPFCPLCGSDRLWASENDRFLCGGCGATIRGPLPVSEPVEPDGAFL